VLFCVGFLKGYAFPDYYNGISILLPCFLLLM